MTVLEARGVGVAWAASVPVLRDVSFTLSPGYHGLVGANGAGKTTLLRVLAGQIEPHEGAVHVRPADATIAYCPQAVLDPGADVHALAGADDGAAAEIKGRLGLDPGELERWSTLSPGERKRWQIGAALAREPDVLLLDEPTNHLDADAKARLVGALARFRGIGVIVSHDRALLERLPRAILRVHAGTIAVYRGGYGEARAQWEASRQQAEDAHARASAAVRNAERRLDAARRVEAAADHATSARTRIKGPRDHDGKSMGAKVVAGWAAARAGRTVEVARRGAERAREEVPSIDRDPTLGTKVFAGYEPAPHPVLFHVDAPALRRGDHVVLRDVRVSIDRAARVRIAGANGAGKTTLLDALVASRPGGLVLSLPQELEPDAVRALVADTAAMPPLERGRVLSVVAALGSDPGRVLAHRADGATLSPGEARKLALAHGLGRHAWALVLDEPTNHLDLPTIERLEAALARFPGCVVLVTHDDAFAAAVTDRTLTVADGEVR